MRTRLVSKLLGSKSLKQLSISLSNAFGYRVWISKVPKQNRKNLFYGTDDCCKIKQYRWFQEQGLPGLTYTTTQTEAQNWANETCIIARKTTRGSQGQGIVIVEKGGQVPEAPVYTKYKKKKREFRVHVFKGQIVQILEKKKRKDWADVRETKIRNLANGYVFCSENVAEPAGLRELAIKASAVTKSDFAGVDIGYNEKHNELFIIEVNSCPGIQGNNIHLYTQAIINHV